MRVSVAMRFLKRHARWMSFWSRDQSLPRRDDTYFCIWTKSECEDSFVEDFQKVFADDNLLKSNNNKWRLTDSLSNVTFKVSLIAAEKQMKVWSIDFS